MNRIYLALLIVFVIFSGCIFEVSSVNKITDDLSMKVQSAEEYVVNNDLSSAVEVMDQINNLWDKKYAFFAIFIPHDRLENIDQSLKSIRAGLKNNEKEQFFSESEKVKASIKSLRETESAKIQNIL